MDSRDVGWQAAKTSLGFDGHPTVVYVKAQEDALEAVSVVLPRTLYPQLPGLVQVSRPSDALAVKRATHTAFSSLFLGLALLVGGIGVANTMYISVLERCREIGLRRAPGANRAQIRGQFLTEAVMLSLLGGATGTAIGVLATAAWALGQGWPPVVPVTVIGAGVGGAVVIGMLAGVYPSFRASRLTPTGSVGHDLNGSRAGRHDLVHNQTGGKRGAPECGCAAPASRRAPARTDRMKKAMADLSTTVLDQELFIDLGLQGMCASPDSHTLADSRVAHRGVELIGSDLPVDGAPAPGRPREPPHHRHQRSGPPPRPPDRPGPTTTN